MNAAATSELKATLVVGMEVHVELATRTKMWSPAPNVAHADHAKSDPNTLLDAVTIGLPGTLPVINRQAVEMSIRVGLALNCKIASFTKWDRKSYYYPDLPKNYQISQYDLPLCYDGAVDIPVTDGSGNLPDASTKRIGITRAHLEEDAGKLAHEAPGGGMIDHSIVDLNRAGTPLLEIVTEPDFSSADEVEVFCRRLRDLVRHLGVSDAVMEQGQMRFEPNINVVIEADGKVFKTPVVEIKNLNSFAAVRGAIEYEQVRQVEAWKADGKVMGARAKSTRGWDDAKRVTVLQREKEDADEYRYFPDPDLVPVLVDEAWVEEMRRELPDAPEVVLDRLRSAGIGEKEATAIVDDPALTRFYEACNARIGDPKRIVALLLNTGAKHANERGVSVGKLGVTAEQVEGIMDLVDEDKISSSGADKLFALCADSDEDAEAIAEAGGLMQVSDTAALEGYVDQVLADEKNAKAVADIQGGKDKAIGALLGQIMKLSKGQANPKLVRELILGKVRG
ncbi:MAG: Asp-tRNA(Asn)/Glu-tRNA(Gln) amidotransferase subunit GatB [Planctomycetota bacterium]